MPRIFMGGAESIELLRTLLDNQTKDIMLSFFYVQQRGALPQIIKLLTQYPQVRVFMDSGAKTFRKTDHGDPQTYWRAYYELLKQHGHRFEYASEFNVDGYAWKSKGGTRTVNLEQVEVWRDDLRDLTMVPIVPIWTPDRGLDAWDALCADPRYPHIGIGDAFISKGGDARISQGGHARISTGGGDARISKGEGGKLVARAHNWQKTVHGYGQIATLAYLPFTRLDTLASSNWLVGQKFGDILTFKGGHLHRIYAGGKGGKKERKKYRSYFLRLGVDPDKIAQDDRQEINKANILAMNQFSARLQLVHTHKGPPRPSVPPETTIDRADGGQTPFPPENAVQGRTFIKKATTPGRTEVLPAEHTNSPNTIIPLRSIESLSVEKNEESAIHLLQPKTFMPPGHALLCSNCAMSTDCPKFGGEGAVCAYQAEFAQVGTRDANEVVEELAAIFSVNVERARYLRLWEQIQGGGLVEAGVTKHMEQTFQMGAKLAELMKGKKSVKTTASGEGVLSRYFGGLGAPQKQVIAGEEPHQALPENYEEDEDEILDTRTERQKRQVTRPTS
jgi:hypothetical protein